MDISSIAAHTGVQYETKNFGTAREKTKSTQEEVSFVNN